MNDKESVMESETILFRVASALLKELGERLVGKTSTALAELIKNSYDADATAVNVLLGNDDLRVSDNGHGMTKEEFRDYWMMIGSQHKRQVRVSRNYKRPLTGSKGVGRLATQFLAHKVKVITKASDDRALVAEVDWDEAVEAGDLTAAKASLRDAYSEEADFPGDANTGTIIELEGLKQLWDKESVKNAAREIWMLQPPSPIERARMNFSVKFTSDKPGLEEDFGKQMGAVLDIWHARIQGKIVKRLDKAGHPASILQISVEFDDGKILREEFAPEKEVIDSVEYEIRIYDLVGKQRFGISVDTAREYLRNFCGVSVYDAGFKMPFYGQETDWLGIEVDHSHRITLSRVLPQDLQETAGMTNLPTMTRILGSVKIDTSSEERAAENRSRNEGDHLKIAITRDRLIDNAAYTELKRLVRLGIDFYAVCKTRKMVQKRLNEAEGKPATQKIKSVEAVLDQYKEALPGHVHAEIKKQLAETVEKIENERIREQEYIGLLGSLATAGMAAAAYQHEIGRRLSQIEGTLNNLESLWKKHNLPESEDFVTIGSTIDEMRNLRSLFSFFIEEESREKVERYRVEPTVREVFSRLERFMRGTRLETVEIPGNTRFPQASFMEWSAILQNVFTNAANAMLDSREKRLRISVIQENTEMILKIEDTGSGVDLKKAESFFQPFVRGLSISAERRGLGLGGTGLGLTIVRMIADKIGCRVGFRVPSDGFKTCFALTWRES